MITPAVAFRGRSWYKPPMSNTRHRLVLITLGGLSRDLAVTLAASGRLPHLARLLETHAVAIDAELPAAAPVNRASLLTAAGPGSHGLFGATSMDPAAYIPVLEGVDGLGRPTLPERLAAAGLTAVCLGPLFPETAVPPHQMPDQPPSVATLAGELRPILASRRNGLTEDAAGDDWDLLFVDLSGITQIFHWYYTASLDSGHPEYGPVLDLLADWDRTLGAALDRYATLSAPMRLLAVADHGMTGCVAEFDCNTWLAAKGLLATGPREDGSLRILPHKTAAFALDAGCIHINTKERFARGVFHEHVAVKLAKELREELLGLTFEGRPVLEAVLLADDFADGPLPLQAPDCICVPQPGFAVTARYDRTSVFGRYGAAGCPTAHGALFCDTDQARPARMREVGAAIARYFNLPDSNARA